MFVKKEELVKELNNPSPDIRRSALHELLQMQPRFHMGTDLVNLHIHSFFSYNSYDWSPSRIAWEAKQNGLQVAGIIDFDVLDGLEEYYWACDLLELRGSVGIETRAFLHEYTDKVIDSPGEPGVSYIAGAGFGKKPRLKSTEEATLSGYQRNSTNRNKALVQRINVLLSAISIDYDQDVLPLTPSGNATERHIIAAYIQRSLTHFSSTPQFQNFWSGVLNLTPESVSELFLNRNKFDETVRSKLAKRGGLGYAQPGPESFPSVEEFFSWVKSCGAIPMESWLDGTSEGESDGKALLELSRSKGAMLLNIIPERNWNIKDPHEQKQKWNNLKSILEIAESMQMPVHIGTEMNRAGLPFADPIDNEFLIPFKEIFLRGARIVTGHVLCNRFAGFSYGSEASLDYFGRDKTKENHFFERAGKLPTLTFRQAEKLGNIEETRAFDLIMDSVGKNIWTIAE
jgi:hypothetical protein